MNFSTFHSFSTGPTFHQLMQRSSVRFARLYTLFFSLHWKLYVEQLCTLDVFHVFDRWLPNLTQPQKRAFPCVTRSHNSGPCWCLDEVDCFGIVSIPCDGANSNIWSSSCRTGLLAWLRPLIASSKESVSPFQCYYETDSSADGIGDAYNWGHFRAFFLRGAVVLLGTSADKEW